LYDNGDKGQRMSVACCTVQPLTSKGIKPDLLHIIQAGGGT